MQTLHLWLLTHPAALLGPTPPAGTPSLSGFFNNLYGQITLIALGMSTFFFAWAAILYSASGTTGNERTKTHAISALYAALVGLCLALLAGTIASIISTAAGG